MKPLGIWRFLALPLFAALLSTQLNAAQPAKPTATPSLDLPRIKSQPKPGDLAPVAKSKVLVDDLRSQGASGGKAVTRQEVNLLTVDAGKDCTRTLRGAANDITFVSFLAYASDGTTVDVGGAKLRFTAAAKPGYLQVSVATGEAKGTQWRLLGEFAKIEKHDRASLAPLPVFTVRLDPVARVWDLYSFNRLVAEDLPLPTARGSATKLFSLNAGREGAWLCHLVSSDENPLFEDANNNGIDDKFEKQKRGALLAASATAADRNGLAQQWKENQQTSGAKAWTVRRPLPDGAPVAPLPRK